MDISCSDSVIVSVTADQWAWLSTSQYARTKLSLPPSPGVPAGWGGPSSELEGILDDHARNRPPVPIITSNHIGLGTKESPLRPGSSSVLIRPIRTMTASVRTGGSR
jgi:hypothetical protein